MSRPIKATPTLYGKHARKFLKQVEEDLKHPVGPVPTPKLAEVTKRIMEDARKKVEGLGCTNPDHERFRGVMFSKNGCLACEVERHKSVEESVKELLKWVPESVDLQKISRINYPVSVFGKVYDIGDAKQPFFSEAYLYNLLGKEDARTLLALMRRLCRTLDIENDL